MRRMLTGKQIEKLDKLSPVEANPTDEATASLTKLKIDNIIYSIEGGGSSVEEIYFATYGTTTYDQVTNALNSGKLVIAKYLDNQFRYIGKIANKYWFTLVNNTNVAIVQLSLNGWTTSLYEYEKKLTASGEGIIITRDAIRENTYISIDTDVMATVDYVDQSVTGFVTEDEVDDKLEDYAKLTDISNKLDKVSTTDTYARLYGVAANGGQNMYQLTSGNIANTIAARNSNGQINVADPTADAHTANKRYVDNHHDDTKQDVITNYVTTDTNQTITGKKTFDTGNTLSFKESEVSVTQLVGASSGTRFIRMSDSGFYIIDLPTNGGTLALTSDIPSLDNYVTTDTEQTISGAKKFAGSSPNITITPAGGATTGTYSTIGYDGFTTRNGSNFFKTEYNTSNYTNKFGYKMNSGSGTVYISLPNKTDTLATLSDIYYVANDTFTNINYIGLNGFITNASKQIQFTLTLPKSLANLSGNITVNKFSCVLRGIAGYVNGSSYIDYANTSGYTVTATKSADNMVNIVVASDNALSSATNNTVVSAVFNTGNIQLTF